MGFTPTEKTNGLDAPGAASDAGWCGVAPYPKCNLETFGFGAVGSRIGVEVQVGAHPYVRYWHGQHEGVSPRSLGSGVRKLGKRTWFLEKWLSFDTPQHRDGSQYCWNICGTQRRGTFFSPAPVLPWHQPVQLPDTQRTLMDETD